LQVSVFLPLFFLPILQQTDAKKFKGKKKKSALSALSVVIPKPAQNKLLTPVSSQYAINFCVLQDYSRQRAAAIAERSSATVLTTRGLLHKMPDDRTLTFLKSIKFSEITARIAIHTQMQVC